MLEGSEILFVGTDATSPFWYRCALPAIHLGADWVGVRGRPPGLQVVTGLVRGNTSLPRWSDYKIVVLQQVSGRAWLKQINKLRAQGIKVLYEIDDYVHGVGKLKDHDYARYYTKQGVRDHELCMRVCDGIICSTEYLARRYRKFNPTVYVCRIGLDLGRYQVTRPERKTVNVLWCGATGHARALLPWMRKVIEVMADHPWTCLVTIGQPQFAQAAGRILGEERALGIPFTAIECYPAAMTMGDIALAPAGDTAWYRAKSDLRWLEASALGIPTIADPVVYPEIEHTETGLHAGTPDEMADWLRYLVTYSDERARIGENARDHVETERASDIAAAQWLEVLNAAVGEYESLNQLTKPTPQTPVPGGRK